jgi:hypothetical protein
MKIRPARADFFMAGGRTHRQTRRNSRFTQFCERAKNGKAEMEDITYQGNNTNKNGLVSVHRRYYV